MSATKRVLLAGLFHETHTFLPGEITLADCDVLRGEELLRCEGDASPLGGILEVARQLKWNVVPSIDVRVMPGPIISDGVIDTWWTALTSTIGKEIAFDGIFLVLHGAMVSRSLPDVEGEVLERMRRLIGEDVPLVGVTDLHGNFSARMAQFSNVLVTYSENPHTDAREAAERAAHILNRLMHSGEHVVHLFESTPIIWPPTGTATSSAPMRTLEEFARATEAADPDILVFNAYAGYSFSDVPDAGVSFSVSTVGAPENARRYLQRAAEIAWELRHDGNVVEPPFEQIWPDVRAALDKVGDGPVVIAEPSDNIGGGAPGDGTGLLRCFIKYGLAPSAIVLDDARAVATLQTMTPGETAHLSLGGASGIAGAGPLELEVELLSLSNGQFTLEDPHSHLASIFGLHIEMGPCATVCHKLPSRGDVFILLTSSKTAPFDLGQLRSQGIVPEEMAVIGVKAAVAHRRAYDPIARAAFSAATPGVCTSDLKALPFNRLRRPIFPLDEIS